MFSQILKDLELPSLQLIRDVETRWSSVYFMIKRARILQKVCFKGLTKFYTEFELGN
jgi:hypothetical protein